MSSLLILERARFSGLNCDWDCPHRTLKDVRIGTFPWCGLFKDWLLRSRAAVGELASSVATGQPALFRLQACLDASALYLKLSSIAGEVLAAIGASEGSGGGES